MLRLAPLLLLPSIAPGQSAAPALPVAPTEGARPAPGPADLLQLVLDKRVYFALPSAMQHASGLTPEQTSYFEGMLAFHQGRFEDARKDLIAAVNARHSVLSSNQQEAALETLGETARYTFHYDGCAQMYADIDKIWGTKLGPQEIDITQKRHFCVVQMTTPPQTIDFTTPFTIQRQGMEYPVRVGQKDGLAVLDTGATESVIPESTAKSWGVVPGTATAAMHGYSGGVFMAHPATVPLLTIGTATLHNIAVMVVPDKDFYISAAKLQMPALLGYPVLAALGRLTFAGDGSLTASPTSPADAATQGVPLWLGDSILSAQMRTLNTAGASFHFETGNELRLFALDTGSRDSYFTDRYFGEHQDTFPGKPTAMAKLAGAGGEVDVPAYTANHIPLWCGGAVLSVTGPHVLTGPTGGVLENYEGLLGRDLLDGLRSYTIDLRVMRLSMTP